MGESLQDLFQTAAKFFFSKYKENGDSLWKLASEIGTSHTYTSAVINGSHTASPELQSHIARALYGPCDKLIAAYRMTSLQVVLFIWLMKQAGTDIWCQLHLNSGPCFMPYPSCGNRYILGAPIDCRFLLP